MRDRFEAQLILGCTPVEEVVVPANTRDHVATLMEVLKYIYVNPQWNRRVFSIMGEKISKGKKKTGRKGMSYWEIFVLAQIRLSQNISYDELHHMANYDNLLRGILGVLPTNFSLGKQYEYQNIYDNVGLLDDEMLRDINQVIVEIGHEVFKKKDEEALRLKIDSFVVETDTHFPTDYNLLWDSARKCIDMAKRLNLTGWRKSGDWRKELKNLMRQVGRQSVGGGQNKKPRLQAATMAYVKKAKALNKKVVEALILHQIKSIPEALQIDSLFYYQEMLEKHIDLIERRLIKGETIPHEEKVFSIFQNYTEMIKKGKLHPNVEIGKKLAITTDQFDLIVDWQIAENQADNKLTIFIADRVLLIYKIRSVSVDLGFSDKVDKELLQLFIEEVIMPKKGKLSQSDKDIENAPKFKLLKNKHSAIESNINELEHRGLDRCPDRNRRNFDRYIALAITAYNLQKIGKKLIADRQQKEKRSKLALAA